MILCHSNARCEEISEFLQELTKFCKDIVEIVSFESLDEHDLRQDWQQMTKNTKKEENKNEAGSDGEEDEAMDKSMIKALNKILVVTPTTALTLFNKNIIDSK